MKERWSFFLLNNHSSWWVSDLGRIRCQRNRDGKVTYIEPFLNRYTGYLSLNLSGNGKRTTYLVHRLVAQAFVQGFSPQTPFVDHKDGDKENNRWDNLRWVSRKVNNTNPATWTQKIKNQRGLDHSKEVLKASRGRRVRYFYNGNQAAKALGCSHVLCYRAALRLGTARRAKGYFLRWVPFTEDLQDKVEKVV